MFQLLWAFRIYKAYFMAQLTQINQNTLLLSSYVGLPLQCIPGIYERQFICISHGYADEQPFILAEDNNKDKIPYGKKYLPMGVKNMKETEGHFYIISSESGNGIICAVIVKLLNNCLWIAMKINYDADRESCPKHI